MPLIKKSAPSRIVWVDSLGSQLANPPIIGGNETNKPGINLIPWDDLKCGTTGLDRTLSCQEHDKDAVPKTVTNKKMPCKRQMLLF